MKAKVCYQDFMLNSGIFCKTGLKLDALKAVFITRIEYPLDKEKFVESVFRVLNLEPIWTVGLKNESRFIEAGHTSMSVGDYVEFEDGEIWICAPCGWEVRK